MNAAETDADDSSTVMNAAETDADDSSTVMNAAETDADDSSAVMNTAETDADDSSAVMNATETDADDSSASVNAAETDADDSSAFMNAAETDADDSSAFMNAAETDADDASAFMNAACMNGDRTSASVNAAETNGRRPARTPAFRPPRRRRHRPATSGGSARARLVEVTDVTFQNRYLLRPSEELNEIFLGVVGEAQALTGMRICAVVVLSTHYHMLLVPDDAEHMADFMQHVNGNLSAGISLAAAVVGEARHGAFGVGPLRQLAAAVVLPGPGRAQLVGEARQTCG